MKQEEFVECVARLRSHIKAAVEGFLADRGVVVDWQTFEADTSIDQEQLVKEILCFAGNISPRETDYQMKAA